MHAPPEVAAEAWSLPLLLRSAVSARTQPVTRGIPFPRGLLTDPTAVALTDHAGREVALQTQVLARWPDGSVRWLLLDFLINDITEGEQRWILRPRGVPVGPSPTTLTVRDTPDAVVVHSGTTEFHAGRTNLSLRARGSEADPSPWEAHLGFPYPGQGAVQTVNHVTIEETGPVRSTIRLLETVLGHDCLTQPQEVGATLRFLGGLFGWQCLYLAQLSFFAGTGLVRMRLTVRNPRRAGHKGGLWDLGDRGLLTFKRLYVSLHVPEVPRVRWATEPGQPAHSARGEGFALYQDSSGGENWQSRNHVNREGRVPCSFRGYKVQHGREESCGLRASPVVALLCAKVALTVALPEFWQQFPKAIQVDGRRLRLALFPWRFKERYELQGGEQKTHTVWLDFGPPAETGDLPLAWVHNLVSVTVPPEWYAACGVIPCLPSAGAERERLDTLLNAAVDGPNSFFARREIIDEYGWRHYGEVYADHENAHYAGPKPIVSHYNNQYDVVYGMLLQYLRTGDARWWDLADPLARHVIDIDIYHTTRDKAAYSGGLFWHTDHYRDAATCTHRAYSKANAQPGRPYGGGPSCEHNYTTGLLHYYYLTGDPLARDAVLELAGWVLGMDDGSRTILGLVDDGPTGLASATREPTYHGPGRGGGNSVNALLDAWLLTGQRHYLEYAETLIRRCVHPADDVAARDLLDIENRWSYTVFLSVLCRYLDLKEEAGELDFMAGYGRASLLHYAGWMEEHERPYFDQPEKLEFPTETWAAQELRKGNVLRLAARYADEPLRSRLRRRGEEFAERAWSDLLRFESRTTARPLAIMMREGPVDLCLRGGGSARTGDGEVGEGERWEQSKPMNPTPFNVLNTKPSVQSPAPTPVEHAFGRPELFVPQRQRVKAQLKTPFGLLRACLRLLSVRRWRRYFSRKRR